MVILSWIVITLGLLFIISGIVALFRFPDFYTKLHAASVIECCGIPLCLIGLIFLQDNWIIAIKLLFITILILILNPVSTHALARASLPYNIEPQKKK